MKISRRITSFLLSAIMVVTTFLAVGPVFSVETQAAITINSFTQTDINIADYEGNCQNFFDGKNSNWPTEFVIPGFNIDYIPQSVTYWAERDWILISVRSTSGYSHYICALDAKSADFVALFSIYDTRGYNLVCKEFSIAASKYNLYMTTSDSSVIGYFPLSEMDITLNADPEQNRKYINMADTISFGDEINNAPLAYCGVDDNILWIGNCYGSASSAKAYNDTYPSALMGYQLKGASSSAEWNNLKGTASTTDCAGNPTHCILFQNNLTDIQHASVNNGKVYILRSNSQLVSSGSTRSFEIADIDINAPGSTQLTINNKTKGCHIIGNNVTTYSGTQVLQHGEAFCIIEDYLYMFGVQAYNSDSSTSPIQVLWKVDQHKLNGVTRPDIDSEVKASHYEKVDSLSELTSGEEYIIAYKSENKDPVTQKEIFYLLDSFGGYGGRKLPRNDTPDGDGKNIGDSIGVIGYALSDYTTDGDKLYISDSVDERKSIRWKISHSNGSGVRLENKAFYYGNSKHLAFDYRHIAMMTENSNYLSYMSIESANNNKFYLSYNKWYYLWCNDGEYPEYIDKYTQYYSDYGNPGYTPNYDGLEEVAGTFHTDGKRRYGALGGNQTEVAVDDALMQFEIYKRVKDPYASAGEQKLRTDYDVKLNENGLYDITIGSYATSAINYYKKLPDSTNRPTDFIFVMDTSRSMRYGYKEFSGATKNFNIGWLLSSAKYTEINNKSVGGYLMDLTADQDEYYKASDGTYHELKLAVRKISTTPRFMFWLYYERDGWYYILSNNGSLKQSSPWSYSTFLGYLQNGVEENSNAADTRAYTDCSNGNYSDVSGGSFKNVPHYVIVNSSGEGDNGRIGVARDFIKQMVDRIADDDYNHRIALCQFTGTPEQNIGNNNSSGAFTGFFTTSSTVRTNIPHGYVDYSGYENAFHNASNSSHITNLKNILARFDYVAGSADGYGNGGGSDLSYGMHMAYKMLTASGNDYSYYGNRHACVIVLTDGGITTDDSQCNLEYAGSAATSSIMISSRIKALGASVYTIRIGEETITNLDANNLLTSISSNRVDGTGIYDAGTTNPSYQNYSYKLTLDNYDSYYTSFYFYKGFLQDVRSKEHHTVAKLGTQTVIREKFDTKIFKQVSGVSSVSAQKVKAYYDALGRLNFDYNSTESLTSPTVDWTNGTITANGFDYSKHHVSSATATKDGTARKFVITIKNVAINEQYANKTDPTADYVNAQVDINSSVGLYRDSDALSANSIYKGFPSDRIRIPQYTYVLDYGLPMSDPHVNGTIVSVDTQLRQQTSANPFLPNNLNIGVNGMFTDTNGNTELLYSVRPSADGTTGSYALIKRPNGDYDWFKLNIVPASNVYFEESTFSATNTTNTDWSLNGLSVNTYQDLHSDNDIYGKDSGYESSTSPFSNGTHYSVTLSADQKQSETLSMTFTGTGFELYGACGADTGIQVINVKKDGKTVKAAVVDTFYKDTQNYGTLYQAPVYNVSGLDYGTYTVEVTAAYLPSISGAVQQAHLDEIPSSINPDIADALLELGFDEILEADEVDVEWFDDNSVLNGGTGAIDTESFSTQSVTALVNYVDAIRIFEPALNGDDYYIESEKNARYYNINDNLMSASNFITGEGFVYVEGQKANDRFEIGAADYNKKGSKHEVYLANGNSQALTFTVANVGDYNRAMLSLRSATGAPITVKIGGNELTVSSKTDMYYDITGYVQNGTVTIENMTENSLLAIGYLKLTGQAVLDTTSDLSSAIEMIETPIGGEEIISGSITNIEYTPSTDSHNFFNVTVNGRPTMIQFIEEDGGTRTYDRNNKNVVIKSYNADGAQVNSLDRTVAYEVWTISTNLTGPDVRVRAKYLVDGAYKWEKDCYSFTYEILEPVLDADIRSITPAAVSGKKGSVEVKVVTGPDAEGIRFVMPNSTTCTYYAAKAVTLENGDLEFTGKAWMNEDSENLVKVYIRENGKWIEAGEISYTAE